MVKADVRRDYYADLGLQPSAETEDIKKQFRKLALKYHPDRNPGKEQDFIARFQAIQAANEILSDPHQRLKYDTDRLRAGYGKVYGPPKTNTTRRQAPTYATTQPPKPQPPRQQYSSRPQTSSKGPSAGAQRYAAHARAGPQQWQKPQDEAQTRADAFRAFHGMRGSNTAGWRGFDPETGRATPPSGGTPRQQNAPFGAQRPKSAYEYFKDSMKSQGPSSPNSPKKRNGFAPGTAGGDEPMARNTSAYTSTRSERPSSMYFDSAPPPTAKKPPAPEMAPSFAQRTGTSYATSGGEKTFFSSSGLGRSSTVRTPSGSYRTTNSRTTPSSPVNGESERHHSASPKARRNRTYSVSTSSSELEDDDTEDEVRPPNAFKPKAVPKSRLGPNQKFADFYRHENSSSGLGENPPTRSSSHHFRPPTPRPSDGWRRPAPSRGAPYFMDSDADTYEYKGHNSDSAAFPKGSYRPDPQAQSKDSINSAQNRTNSQSTPFEGNIPGNLHKKFSAEDWREHLHKFDFIGASASPTDRQSPNTHNRPRASTRTDSTQTGTSTGSPGFKSFSPGPGNQSQRSQPPPQQVPTPFAQAKFHADQWFEKVKDISWNAQEADKARSSSNTPPRSPKKQARSGTKVRSAPQAASVATESDEAKDTINGNAPPEPSQSAPADAEAMDIDEPPGPTNVMPDSPSAGDSRSTSYPDLTAHATQVPPAGARKSQPTPQAEGGTPNREIRTPLFDLDNLRNTVPFTSTNNGGIENLEDVHANLPFDSRAKQPTTTKRDIQPRELKLPNPPKRPWAPQPTAAYAGSQQLTLSRDKWNWYVSAMSTYMHDWNTFNRRMLLHFNTRQEAIETGLSPKWISAVGDTTRLHIDGADEEDEKSETREDVLDESDDLVPGSGKGGFSAYLRGIEEDIQVRKHWDVACELHRECILDLGRLREWIRNGGKVA